MFKLAYFLQFWQGLTKCAFTVDYRSALIHERMIANGYFLTQYMTISEQNDQQGEVMDTSKLSGANNTTCQLDEAGHARRQALIRIGKIVGSVFLLGGLATDAPQVSNKKSVRSNKIYSDLTKIHLDSREDVCLTDDLIEKMDKGFGRFTKQFEDILTVSGRQIDDDISEMIAGFDAYKANLSNPYRNRLRADLMLRWKLPQEETIYCTYMAYAQSKKVGKSNAAFMDNTIYLPETYDPDNLFDNIALWHEHYHKSQAINHWQRMSDQEKEAHRERHKSNRKKMLIIRQEEEPANILSARLLDLFLDSSISCKINQDHYVIPAAQARDLLTPLGLRADQKAQLQYYIEIIADQAFNGRSFRHPTDYVRNLIEKKHNDGGFQLIDDYSLLY